MQLSKKLVERRERRELYAPPTGEEGAIAVELPTGVEMESWEGVMDLLGSSRDVQQARLHICCQ